MLLLLREHHPAITANPDLSLTELLHQQFTARYLPPPADWFRRKLKEGTCLVMLDGLDEVADAKHRQQVGRWVNQQMSAYPRACFILTSRPYGYLHAPLEQVGTVLAVQPFNLQDIEQFLDNWYLQNETMRRLGRIDAGVRRLAAERAANLKRRIVAHSALASMAVNPLLLTMIAIVHDNRGALPERRVDLYAEICDMLLGRRQEAKGLADTLSAGQKRRVLQSLALTLMEANTRACTLEEGSRHIRERLRRVAGLDSDPQGFLKQIETLSGLLVQREAGEYEFAHKSFQEYLAAVEIKEANLEEYLLDKLSDPWWEETVRLYAVQAHDASGLLQTIFIKPTITSLALAYECLEEGTEVRPELRQALQERGVADLESPDADRAKLAAQVKLVQRLKHLTALVLDQISF